MSLSSSDAFRASVGRRLLAPVSIALLILAGCRDATGPAQLRADGALPARSASDDNGGRLIPDQYIVVFKDDVTDIHGRVSGMVKQHGADLHYTYTSGIHGFAGRMNAGAAASLRNHPSVSYVEQDREVAIDTDQSGATWGLDRVDQSSLPLNSIYSYTCLLYTSPSPRDS